VIYKAEVMAEGTNTRFVVTNRMHRPTELYEWYIKRGENENRIKDFQSPSQGRPIELPSFFGQPVQAALTRGGLLAIGRFKEKTYGGGHRADAA
jgi:hypothetical protein